MILFSSFVKTVSGKSNLSGKSVLDFLSELVELLSTSQPDLQTLINLQSRATLEELNNNKLLIEMINHSIDFAKLS
jgi:hypothetical protein